MRNIIVLFLFFVVMISCTPSAPNGILSEGEMEDVLYDLHLAQSMFDAEYSGSSKKEYYSDALKNSVFEKHGITEEQWDSSFNYYCRNSDRLYVIYKSLNQRLQVELLAMGGKALGVQGEEADTSDVWNAERNVILMQNPPYNIYTYEIKPDSTFEDGDKLTLQFDTQFIFQDGYRDLLCYMAVYYDNDSIATFSNHISSDGHGVLVGNNNIMDRKRINKIKGYFILCKNLGSKEDAVSMRLVSVNNIKFLHTHTQPPVIKIDKEEEKDSVPVDTIDKLRIDNVRDEELLKH